MSTLSYKCSPPSVAILLRVSGSFLRKQEFGAVFPPWLGVEDSLGKKRQQLWICWLALRKSLPPAPPSSLSLSQPFFYISAQKVVRVGGWKLKKKGKKYQKFASAVSQFKGDVENSAWCWGWELAKNVTLARLVFYIRGPVHKRALRCCVNQPSCVVTTC